tara:strand:+ start:35335 stop:36609 length:1275 start_codon:yes stop_codon:yes gene_type:complete
MNPSSAPRPTSAPYGPQPPSATKRAFKTKFKHTGLKYSSAPSRKKDITTSSSSSSSEKEPTKKIIKTASHKQIYEMIKKAYEHDDKSTKVKFVKGSVRDLIKSQGGRQTTIWLSLDYGARVLKDDIATFEIEAEGIVYQFKAFMSFIKRNGSHFVRITKNVYGEHWIDFIVCNMEICGRSSNGSKIIAYNSIEVEETAVNDLPVSSESSSPLQGIAALIDQEVKRQVKDIDATYCNKIEECKNTIDQLIASSEANKKNTPDLDSVATREELRAELEPKVRQSLINEYESDPKKKKEVYEGALSHYYAKHYGVLKANAAAYSMKQITEQLRKGMYEEFLTCNPMMKERIKADLFDTIRFNPFHVNQAKEQLYKEIKATHSNEIRTRIEREEREYNSRKRRERDDDRYYDKRPYDRSRDDRDRYRR